MHSVGISVSLDSNEIQQFANQSWNPRLVLKYVLYRGAIYLVMSFVDNSSRTGDFDATAAIVYTG
jgi:hypothetical protein